MTFRLRHTERVLAKWLRAQPRRDCFRWRLGQARQRWLARRFWEQIDIIKTYEGCIDRTIGHLEVINGKRRAGPPCPRCEGVGIAPLPGGGPLGESYVDGQAGGCLNCGAMLRVRITEEYGQQSVQFEMAED